MQGTTDDLRGVATRILEAQDKCLQLASMSSLGLRLSMHDAYRVSWFVHEARVRQGWKPVGRKIGFTNKDMWALFGVDQPVWSFVYDKTYEDVAAGFGCPLGALMQPKIEPEIVFCMRRTPSVGADQREILDCVEWMAHGIEMVQCHYPNWKFDSADAICDASFHGKLFVGEKLLPRSASGDVEALLKDHEVRLFKGETLVELGRGENVLGSPLLAVSSLLDAIARDGAAYPIQPGEVITTGTITKAHSVLPGERWRTEFGRNEFEGLTIDFV